MNSLEQRLNDYIVKAPVDGTINQLFVSRGNATGLGTPVCEIVGGKSVKIEAKINPEQAKYLHVGLKAILSSEFGHGENIVFNWLRLAKRRENSGVLPPYLPWLRRKRNHLLPGAS